MSTLLQAGGAADPALPSGYGLALVQTLLALAAVCVLAWVALRWLSRRGARGLHGARVVQIVERVPLDARRSLFVVRAGGRVLLVGAGDGGALTTLAELAPEAVPDPPPVATAKVSFRDVLRKLGRVE